MKTTAEQWLLSKNILLKKRILEVGSNINKLREDIPNNWQPQWTTQVKIEGGGRYPLGLNKFHDGLEEILIKGIVVQANRLHYITYCCWAIGDIEKREKCTAYSDFVEAFCRRENALGLGLFQIKPKYSVPGSTALSKIVKEGAKEYDCSFDLMQSNELGVFGLYYKGTIHNFGLTESNEKGIITLTELGRGLYAIAEKYFNKTNPEYCKKFAGRRKVPSQVLLEWGKINDLDNIRKPACKEEQEFYKTLIYRLGKNKVSDYRRDTFTFFMECIDRCTKTKTPFDEDVLRNIHYYSCYYKNSNKVCKFAVSEHFKDVHFYWFIYEGHVYFRWWLELYFNAFLQYLKSCDNGATRDDFFEQIDPAEFNATIFDFCKKRRDYYNNSMKSVLALFPEPSKLLETWSEEAIYEDEDHTSTSCVLAKFLLITTNLFRKYKNVISDKRYQYLVANLGSDLWFNVLYHFHNLEQIPVHEFLKIVLKRYIIDQHDLIMIEKNDLRRCWFTTENKRYFFQADVSPIWRPAKYETIMNFLYDMNLIDNLKGTVKLSQDGENFLNHLIQKYYLDDKRKSSR
jgi:hypothetical protein